MESEARREDREPLGRRVARYRTERGWTQQDLADRLAMSRTAVSHLEAGMSHPSERTVLILSGLFAVEPPEFVEGTLYPIGKAERLPAVAARYTEFELQMRLIEREVSLLVSLESQSVLTLRGKWIERMEQLLKSAQNESEAERIVVILRKLRSAH